MRKKKVTAILIALLLCLTGNCAAPSPAFAKETVSATETAYKAEEYGTDEDYTDETEWEDEDWPEEDPEEEDPEEEYPEEEDEKEYAKEHWYDNEQPDRNISSKDLAPDKKASVVGKTGNLQIELSAYNAAKVTFRMAQVTKEEAGKYLYGYSEFFLYRSESPDGPFSCLNSSYSTDYQSQLCTMEDYALKRGTTYYYKVRQKYVGYASQENYWSYKGKKITLYFDSNVKAITTMSDKEVLHQVSLDKPGSASLTWKSLGDAVDSYIIYRAEGNKNGTYEPIKTVQADEGIRDYYRDDLSYSYKDKTLVYGKKYFYKISAHTIFDLDTSCNVIKNVISGPDKVKISKMKCPKSGNITIQWKKVEKATGYVVYRSTDNLKFKKVKTVKDPNTTTASFSGLSHGTVYYFKVRAYDDSQSTTLWGIENESKSKAMDYYLCPASEMSRDQRFGNLDFKTSQDADKQMRTIKIKTWDINKATNQKYTRYFYLTVHKNAAPTVQKIFDEIYRGKEKFPIHSIGGYAWRSDSSTSEHHYGLAIDINSDENWMPSRKVGNYWRPGKDPYSITPDGDVVTIMYKYGFYWLGEYDAMHFSVSGT